MGTYEGNCETGDNCFGSDVSIARIRSGRGTRDHVRYVSSLVQRPGMVVTNPLMNPLFLQIHSKSVERHPEVPMARRTEFCCHYVNWGLD